MSDTPPEKLPYKPFLDKNGNPKISQFGHVVSARLTKDEEAQIDAMIAQGKTQKEIVATLGTTQTRVATYLKQPQVAERIMLIFQTQTLARELSAVTELLKGLLVVMERQDVRLNDCQNQLRKVDANARRQRIGRATAEKERRTLKGELTKLKTQMWQRTGKRF